MSGRILVWRPDRTDTIECPPDLTPIDVQGWPWNARDWRGARAVQCTDRVGPKTELTQKACAGPHRSTIQDVIGTALSATAPASDGSLGEE